MVAKKSREEDFKFCVSVSSLQQKDVLTIHCKTKLRAPVERMNILKFKPVRLPDLTFEAWIVKKGFFAFATNFAYKYKCLFVLYGLIMEIKINEQI